MKTILLLSIFLSLFLSSCIPTKELSKEDLDHVYSHNIKMSKDSLKIKLLEYINENFHSSKSVVQTNEDGLLSGNGIFDLGTIDLLNTTTLYEEMTFIVKYQDNNYKVKFLIKDLYLKNSSVENHMTPGNWGYYSEKVEKSYADQDQKLYSYLADSTNTF